MPRSGRHRSVLIPALAAGVALSCLVSGEVRGQQLRPGVAPARTPPAYDPTAVATGVGVGQPIDPTAIYATPSGAAASGATSAVRPRRAARPVRTETSGDVRRPVRSPAPAVTRLPDEVPALPPPPLKKRPLEEDPYAALGVRVGSVVLRPAITQSGGYDDNPERLSTNARGSWLSRTEGELGIRSDWSRHELTGDIKGGYTRYFDAPDASRPEANGKLNLRIDVLRETTLDFETRASLETQRPGSPDLGGNVVGRPAVYGYGASAGATQGFNRFSVSLRGAVDRTTYEDGRLSGGGVLDQSDRDVTQYGVRLRGAYEVTPGFKPFVEALADTRQFDRTVDSGGFRRSSNGVGGRVGSSFEITRLLTGEVAVGYQTRKYDDRRLDELRGLIGEASLVWTPSELTTFTLKGSTDLADTTIPGVSGAVNRKVELQVAHALRRDLTVTGTGAFAQTDYDGITLREDTTTLGARVDWKLTRTVAVRASFTHERLKSTAANSDYTANAYLLGLRLQL